MKKINSMKSLPPELKQYLSDTARLSKTYGKYMASYVSIFSMLMKTCKGRDKICSFIQYSADFYYHCNKYSEIEVVQKAFKIGALNGAIVALKLRNSMKNSRKIFKFLKFIDHISSIIKKVTSDKPLFMKIVEILQNISACIANIFDNFVWGINIQVLDYWFAQKYKHFKANKYFFSLCKVIFKMLGSNFEHHYRIKNMKQIVLKLRMYKQLQISESNPTLQLSKRYLSLRREFQIQNLDAAINVCRIVMLIRKLKLPGYTFVTKILYSAMGLFSTFLSVLKMIVQQPVVVQIWGKQQKYLKKKQSKNNEGCQRMNENKEMDENGFGDVSNAKRIRINRSETFNFK